MSQVMVIHDQNATSCGVVCDEVGTAACVRQRVMMRYFCTLLGLYSLKMCHS